jgi:hypothetical protein
VVEVMCLFCEKFGREENVGEKRKFASTIKFYSTFRPDLYQQHLNGQHKSKWEEYQTLSKEEKRKFLNIGLPFASTLDAHFDYKNQALSFIICPEIVDIIIKDMLFNLEQEELVDVQEALKVFQPVMENGEIKHYQVISINFEALFWKSLNLCAGRYITRYPFPPHYRFRRQRFFLSSNKYAN